MAEVRAAESVAAVVTAAAAASVSTKPGQVLGHNFIGISTVMNREKRSKSAQQSRGRSRKKKRLNSMGFYGSQRVTKTESEQ